MSLSTLQTTRWRRWRRCSSLPLRQHLEQQLSAPAVQLHVAKFVYAQQIDASVAGDGLGQDPLVRRLDQLVDQLGGECVADPEAGHGGLGAERDQQVGLASARVADQAERQSLLDPLAGRQGVNDGCVDVPVGLEVEGPQRLLPRELRRLDPPFGASPGPVVTLGHQQLGEEPAIGHLVTGGGFGQFGELGPDGGQPEHAACLVNGGVGGLFGQSAMAFERHGISPWMAGRSAGCRSRSSWS
jgi:hypothetical protein